MKKKLLKLIIVFSVGFPFISNANPIDVTPAFAIALGVEAVALALILIPFKFDWVRVFSVWFVVTLLTWVGMIITLALLSDPLAKLGIKNLLWFYVPAEAVVVTVESFILVWLARWQYMRKQPYKLSYPKALVICIVINALSVVSGGLMSGMIAKSSADMFHVLQDQPKDSGEE